MDPELTAATALVRSYTGCPSTVFDDTAVGGFLDGCTYLSDPDDAESSVYDAYAAAADLCVAWAVRLSTEVDFQADGASMSRSQKAPALRASAKELRRLAHRGSGERAPSDARWR